MKHSDQALKIVTEFEGLDLHAYQDQRGIWTIGYGHTFGVEKGMTITKAQALLYLNSDIVSADNTINRLVKVDLTQNQFDALVSLVFNIGEGHFSSSTVLKDLNNKDFNGAADAFLLWKKTNGVDNAGLMRRRAAERALFLTK